MPAFKTIAEVKQQVDNGFVVHWMNDRYKVKKSNGDYLIFDKYNGFCGGNIDNDKPSDFYVLPELIGTPN